MGLNGWLRSHPLLYLPIGAIVAGVGGVRGQPVVIGVGVLIVLYGLVRAFVL